MQSASPSGSSSATPTLPPLVEKGKRGEGTSPAFAAVAPLSPNRYAAWFQPQQPANVEGEGVKKKKQEVQAPPLSPPSATLNPAGVTRVASPVTASAARTRSLPGGFVKPLQVVDPALYKQLPAQQLQQKAEGALGMMSNSPLNLLSRFEGTKAFTPLRSIAAGEAAASSLSEMGPASTPPPPLLTLPPPWAYNQLYTAPGVTDRSRTKIWSLNYGLQLFQSVKGWDLSQQAAQHNDEKEEDEAKPSSHAWLRRSILVPLLPAAMHAAAAEETPSTPEQELATAQRPRRPALKMGVAEPRGILRSGNTPPPHPDRDVTDEENTILSSATLQREMQSHFRTAEGILNSFIVYFPEKVDAMRTVSDRQFEDDIEQANRIQQAALALVARIEEANKPAPKPAAGSGPEEDSDLGLWTSLYSRLVATDAEPLTPTKVSAFPDAVALALFLSWFVSAHARHGRRARTLAAQMLVRLLVARVESAPAGTAEIAGATTMVVPAALPMPTATTTAAAASVSSESSTVSGSAAASGPSSVRASGFGPVRVASLPALEEALKTIADKSSVPPLVGEIEYGMEYRRREGQFKVGFGGGGAAANVPLGQDAETKKLVERVRHLHETLLIGHLTSEERGALRALLLQFALRDVDAALLAPLQSLVLFLADWDQLQASWMTYLSSLSFLLSQDEHPLRVAEALPPGAEGHLVFVAHSVLQAFLAHHSLLSPSREKPDAHYIYLVHVVGSALGQRFLVRGESIDVLRPLLPEQSYGGGPFNNFEWWERSGVCRMLEDAGEKERRGEDGYGALVPYFHLLQAPIFSSHSSKGPNIPFDRNADDLLTLFLPLVLRAVAYWVSPTGLAQAASDAAESARSGRPLDQWKRQPPSKTFDEMLTLQLKPPLEVLQQLMQPHQSKWEQLKWEHGWKEQAYKEQQEKKRKEEAAGSRAPAAEDASKVLPDPGPLVVPPELAATLDRLHAVSASVWQKLRTRFLSTPQAAPAWWGLVGLAKVSDSPPAAAAGAAATAAAEDRRAWQTAFQFDGRSFGFSTPVRQAMLRAMPPLAQQHEAYVCREHVAVSSRTKSEEEESKEGLCAFLARLAVRARILEAADEKDGTKPRYEEKSTLGVRFIDSTLWYEAGQPTYAATESELFAIENLLAFCRSASAHCPLAAALESAALNCAMASDSLALHMLVLTHAKALVQSTLAVHIPPRYGTVELQPFVAAFQQRAAAVASEAKSCLLDASVGNLPNVLSDLVLEFVTPGGDKSDHSLAWLHNVLPFLLACLESEQHAVLHDEALSILQQIPLPPIEDERRSGSHSLQALSLPTVLLRPHFERLLSIAEAEARAEAKALTKEKEEEAAAALAAAAATTASEASSSPSAAPVTVQKKKKKGRPHKNDSPTLMALLVSRLNISLPPSHMAHLPSEFLSPFMSRLAALFLGEPNAKVLLHLMSSPLFRSSLFTDPSLLERLETLVLLPALLSKQQEHEKVAKHCAEGALGRREGATNEGDVDEDGWEAMQSDQIPDPLEVPEAVAALLKQAALLAQPSQEGESSSVMIRLESLPSRAQSLLARCASAAAEQVRCFFLWLETHERRVYFMDDPRSGENYTQYSMTEYAEKLVSHLQEAMRSRTPDEEGAMWLPPDVALWPAIVLKPFRRCLEIYADYEDERPRNAMGYLLAGFALHPRLTRELVWSTFDKALPYFLKAAREEDGGYLAFNAITSIYWHAAASDPKSIPMEAGFALRAALPELQRSLLVPFHPTRHLSPTDAASFEKTLDKHASTKDGADEWRWMNALTQALVVLQHVRSSGCLNAFELPEQSAGDAEYASQEQQGVQKPQQQPDTTIDQVGVNVLGWLHWNFVRMSVANLKDKKTKYQSMGGGDELLPSFHLPLGAYLLEWFASWLLSAQLQPRIQQSVLTDRTARRWFLELDAARLVFPSHIRQQQSCTQWMELIRTLPPLTEPEAAPAACVPAATPTAATSTAAEGSSQPLPEAAKPAATEAKQKQPDDGKTSDAAQPQLPPVAASLIPSAALLTELQKVWNAKSGRLETSFRHAWDLDRESLDARLSHCHSVLQPQLDVLTSPAFAVPLVTAIPLARLLTALSAQLQRVNTAAEVASVPTLCRSLITAAYFALQLDRKRAEKEQKANEDKNKDKKGKQGQPATSLPLVVYTIDPAHPPLPVSELASSLQSLFDAILAVSRVDALPVAVCNWLAQTFGLLFASQLTHPYAPAWLDALMATVPPSALPVGEARWFHEAAPSPAYQDALSNTKPLALDTKHSGDSPLIDLNSAAASRSSWRLPSAVTRFRMLAYVWYRHFGRVDGELIDAYQSLEALAKILVYFSSFLAPVGEGAELRHEKDFLCTLLQRLSSHYLVYHPIYNSAPLRQCYPKIVDALKSFAVSLPVIRQAAWSRLPPDASDAAVSEAMEDAIKGKQLVWTPRDDQLADAFFTTIHWLPLSIDLGSHHGKHYAVSRIFVPLYAAYLQRLAVRFQPELEHEARSTFAAEYAPLHPAVVRENGISWHKHAHPLRFRVKGEEESKDQKETKAAAAPEEKDNKKKLQQDDEAEDEDEKGADEEQDEEEEEEEEEQEEEPDEDQEQEEGQDEDDGAPKKKATLSCRVCARCLASRPHYACASCRVFVCIDCGDPSSLVNLLYLSTKAMFMQLSTKYRWISGLGWPLEHRTLRSGTSTGGYTEERLKQATTWIRPILPLLQHFLILGRRDEYVRSLLKAQPNPAAYYEMPFEPSLSIGLMHDPSHTVVFDASLRAYTCVKCQQPPTGATGSNCSYWCPICDVRTCVPCAEWGQGARHSNAAALESHKEQWARNVASGAAASTPAPSLLPPAFPASALPRESADGLFCGPPLLILYDYIDLLKEEGTTGPLADRLIEEFHQMMVSSACSATKPGKHESAWQALSCYYHVWHEMQQFGRQQLGNKLDDAMAQVVLASLGSKPILVRSLSLPLLLPTEGYITLESELKPILLNKTNRSAYGSALLRLLLTTSSTNSQLLQNASSLIAEPAIALDSLACVDLIVHIGTQSSLSPALTGLAMSTPRTFSTLLSHPETVGLVYAYVRRVLPSLADQQLLQLAAQFGWRIRRHGDTQYKEQDEHAQTLLRLIQNRLEGSFSRSVAYAAAIATLPPPPPPSFAAGSAPLRLPFSPTAWMLAKKMLLDMGLVGELRTLGRWLSQSTLVSFEAIFQQERLSEIGQPVLGFLPSTPLFQSLAVLLGWCIRILPLVPFLPAGCPYRVEAKGAVVSEVVCVLLDVLNWSATVPALHLSFLEPNVDAAVEAAVLCHWPMAKAFDPDFSSAGALESSVLSCAASAGGSASCSSSSSSPAHDFGLPPSAGEERYMSITVAKVEYANMSLEEVRLREEEKPGQQKSAATVQPSSSSTSLAQSAAPEVPLDVPLVVPAGPLSIPVARGLTDSASRLLLRLCSLGLTRPMLLRALQANSFLLLRELLRCLEPMLSFFETVGPQSAAAAAAQGKSSTSGLRLSRLLHFARQLQSTYSYPHTSKSLKPFAEAPLSTIPSWEWFVMLPTLVGVFVQLAQLSAAAPQDRLDSFRSRVEALWGVWSATLAVVPTAGMSTSLLASHAVLYRIMQRRLRQGQRRELDAQVRDVIDLWRAHATPSASASPSSFSSSSSPADFFFQRVVVPRILRWAVPFTTSTKEPLNSVRQADSISIIISSSSTTTSSSLHRMVHSQAEFIRALL